APVELFTDTGFLDPRTDVTVHGVHEVRAPSTPQDLADLISANDEARREMFGRTEPASYDREASGQIRIQAVRTGGGQEAYIVHAPPTAGAGIAHPHSWEHRATPPVGTRTCGRWPVRNQRRWPTSVPR